MADRAASERAFVFGPFRLLSVQRLLLESDKQVRLGSRALEILIALVERAGEVVGKDELMARAWPGTFVEEGNLKFQIGVLRRVLGDGHAGHRYITTIPARGYSFAAAVKLAEIATPSAPTTQTARAHNLPLLVTRLVGRTDTVKRLAEQVQRQRLLTIVGPGGIGKTSVALAVAEALLHAYDHGVWLIDLGHSATLALCPARWLPCLGSKSAPKIRFPA